jgi:hypothetical protein
MIVQYTLFIYLFIVIVLIVPVMKPTQQYKPNNLYFMVCLGIGGKGRLGH